MQEQHGEERDDREADHHRGHDRARHGHAVVLELRHGDGLRALDVDRQEEERWNDRDHCHTPDRRPIRSRALPHQLIDELEQRMTRSVARERNEEDQRTLTYKLRFDERPTTHTTRETTASTIIAKSAGPRPRTRVLDADASVVDPALDAAITPTVARSSLDEVEAGDIGAMKLWASDEETPAVIRNDAVSRHSRAKRRADRVRITSFVVTSSRSSSAACWCCMCRYLLAFDLSEYPLLAPCCCWHFFHSMKYQLQELRRSPFASRHERRSWNLI